MLCLKMNTSLCCKCEILARACGVRADAAEACVDCIGFQRPARTRRSRNVWRCLSFHSCVLLVTLLNSITNADDHPTKPGPQAGLLEYRLEQSVRAVLPFQAVRLRIALRNENSPPVRGLRPIEGTVHGWMWLKPPASERFDRIHEGFRSIRNENPVIDAKVSNRDTYIELTDQEESSVSFALSAEWKNDEFGRVKRQVSFPEAGKYLLHVFYPIQYPFEELNVYPAQFEPAKYLVAQTTVTVKSPCGDDKIIFDMLTENSDLAFSLLSTIGEPDPDVIPQLREIVERFPESTYADYARFALARKELRGTGYYMFVNGADDYTRDRLIKNIFTLFDSELTDEQLWRELDGNALYFGRLKGEKAEMFREALTVRAQPAAVRNEAITKLVGLTYVSTRERIAAVRWLDEIKSKDFAYRPNILIMKRIALLHTERAKKREIDTELEHDYSDSVDWITVQSDLITTQREWHDFRVRLNKRP